MGLFWMGRIGEASRVSGAFRSSGMVGYRNGVWVAVMGCKWALNAKLVFGWILGLFRGSGCFGVDRCVCGCRIGTGSWCGLVLVLVDGRCLQCRYGALGLNAYIRSILEHVQRGLSSSVSCVVGSDGSGLSAAGSG